MRLGCRPWCCWVRCPPCSSWRCWPLPGARGGPRLTCGTSGTHPPGIIVTRGAGCARPPGPDAEAALRRHPAGRGRHAAMVPGEMAGAVPSQWSAPLGPDDDPEFIDALERLIRGDGDGTYPGL